MITKLVPGLDWAVILWRALGFVVAAVLVVLPGWFLRGCVDTSKATEIQAAWDKQTAEREKAEKAAAVATFNETERRYQESQNAQDAYAADVSRARSARDAALSERERLRNEIRAHEFARLEASDAEAPVGTDATAAVALDLLRACTSQYEAVEGEAGELAGRLRGLQRWVTGVCGSPVASRENPGRLND